MYTLSPLPPSLPPSLQLVSTSRTPGHTKHFQTIFLTRSIRLCDCPGLVFPSLVDKQLQVPTHSACSTYFNSVPYISPAGFCNTNHFSKAKMYFRYTGPHKIINVMNNYLAIWLYIKLLILFSFHHGLYSRDLSGADWHVPHSPGQGAL